MYNLKETFQTLVNSTYDDISGVCLLDTGIDGPVLGITIMTHGNEPGGLVAAEIVQKIFDAGDIACGKIFLVINNIQAGQKYFAAGSIDEKRASRYIDVNMNRLPECFDASDTRYEVLRAQELMPIWKQFDVGYDVHSTSQESLSMIVEGTAQARKFTKYFPIKKVLQNIHVVQKGVPAFHYYGHEISAVFEIEAGSHESNATLKCVEDCTLILLQKLGMINEGLNLVEQEQNVYKVTQALFVPEKGYSMPRIFKNFEPLSKGDLLAQNSDGKAIRLSNDGVALFAFNTLKIHSVDEEFMFVAEELA